MVAGQRPVQQPRQALAARDVVGQRRRQVSLHRRHLLLHRCFLGSRKLLLALESRRGQGRSTGSRSCGGSSGGGGPSLASLSSPPVAKLQNGTRSTAERLHRVLTAFRWRKRCSTATTAHQARRLQHLPLLLLDLRAQRGRQLGDRQLRPRAAAQLRHRRQGGRQVVIRILVDLWGQSKEVES